PGIQASAALGTNGTQQVGYGDVLIGVFQHSHALLWTGSADSAVDLNPTNIPGMTDSSASATDGHQQVGDVWTWSAGVPVKHAVLWHGSADSAVDLNPAGFTDSSVNGVSNGKQIGWGRINIAGNALLWSGTAASAINLHQFLPGDFTQSYASGMDATCDVFGV